MALEDEVVGSVFKIGTTLIIDGMKLAVEIVGMKAMVIGLTYKAISKKIQTKEARKEKLTGGEVTFKKIMKSGEDIHAVWLNKSDLQNFSTIAKRLGIPFFAVQNGDEIKKSRKSLSDKNKDLDQVINFSGNYNEMVSISYRASDEVRMAHILEMFDTYDPAQLRQKPVPEQTIDTEKEQTPLDEVEQFMKDNGVEVERPPEVIAYEEVKNQQERASEKNSPDFGSENSKERSETGDGLLMCFEQFGFDEMPSKAEYDTAYKDFVEKNGINTSEPNYITSLYEQGSKIISGEIQPHKPDYTSISPDNVLPECYQVLGLKEAPKSLEDITTAFNNFKEKNRNVIDADKVGTVAYEAAVSIFNKGQTKQQNSEQMSAPKSELPKCFQVLGITEMPKSVSELHDRYMQFVENTGKYLPIRQCSLATKAYEDCLKHMEKGESVRTKLEAKRERNNLAANEAEKQVDKAVAKTADKMQNPLTK